MTDMPVLAGTLTMLSLAASALALVLPRLAARVRTRRVVQRSAGAAAAAVGGGAAALRPVQLALARQLRRVFPGLQTMDRRIDLIRRFRRAGLSQARVSLFLLAKLMSPVALGGLAWVICDTLYGFAAVSSGLCALAAAALGHWAPDLWLRNRIERRKMRIARRWSDALDLLHMCVRSGMSLDAALAKVARELRRSAPDIAAEFRLTVTELNYLQSRGAALENLAERTGLSQVRAVVTALIQSQRYGATIAGTLQTLARQNRAMRVREAEQKAAALPPRLTVPMTVFFLPALFVILVAPAFINVAG
ncbi:type II secretion system F family protein [Roseicyclus amphidinii]|uniref:type II secretion system F family protein n=1 Tax=Roseicyclus amphidinii TaxID=3034232 RepID=UPI0024E194DC|nr:type II secretion system F family protein [Roseicyclus sp. Amp-Y-6]